MTFIESETIELKSSVVADLCKEVIAFANKKAALFKLALRTMVRWLVWIVPTVLPCK